MEPLDWVALRENCAGDEALVNEVLELFRNEAMGLLHDVRVAVAAKDANAIKRSAHRFKGALVSLGAKPAVEAARVLELAGANQSLVTVEAQLATLDLEISRLLSVLAISSAA